MGCFVLLLLDGNWHANAGGPRNRPHNLRQFSSRDAGILYALAGLDRIWHPRSHQIDRVTGFSSETETFDNMETLAKVKMISIANKQNKLSYFQLIQNGSQNTSEIEGNCHS